MSNIIVITLPWLLLAAGSILVLIIVVLLCICFERRKRKSSKQIYILDESSISANALPHVINHAIQKCLVQGVKYSSVNCSDEFSFYSQNENARANVSNGVVSLFKNIQRNKYPGKDCEDQEMLHTLDDSNAEFYDQNFDKSVLRFEWNDKNKNCPDKEALVKDDEDAHSIDSHDTHTTFHSVHPHYNRTHSIADTFRSVSSES